MVPSRLNAERKLPRSYWPIAFVGMLLTMVVAVAFAVEVGIDPYIAALVAGCLYTIRETWIVGREER